jgi:virulence factor Mce-like protein
VRRALGIAVVLAAATAVVVLVIGSSSASGQTYWVELDNAFGLVAGADVKMAGVRAGKIEAFKLDRRTYRAQVEINLSQKGYDHLRSDAFCESRPQSLIGEYFLDCQPGAKGRMLPKGATIPVSHTATTIAPDLVNDILRLPERERLRIIINELGAAVAGNGANLNEAIRRAVPAIRETDRVLAILAQQNQVLADLAHNGDTVITALANNHRNVGRWVQTARNTAEASAQRRAALAATFRKLPAFLAQLRPAMAALGQTAVSQTGALRNLDATSGQLTRFFKLLGPFANASRPAVRTLADASRIGRQAVTSATPTVELLNKYANESPELSKNLRIILEHLDDPSHAVETDQRAGPQHIDGRKNYTGLEALLQYVFDQAQAVNVYDGVEYILKIAAFADPDCSPYNDGHKLRSDDAAAIALYQKCSGNKIGPNGPGLLGEPNVSDNGKFPSGTHGNPTDQVTGGGNSGLPSPPRDSGAASPSSAGAPLPSGAGSSPPTNIVDPVTTIVQQATQGAGSNAPNLPSAPNVPTPQAPAAPNPPSTPSAPSAPNAPSVPNVPDDVTKSVQGALPGGGSGRSSSDRQVLDYLMGP